MPWFLILPGGACGFKHTNQYPFSSMTSCGNEPIFKDGKGCGSCYQVLLRTDHHGAHRTCQISTVGAGAQSFYLVGQIKDASM
jgi:hypothetical protein